MCWCWWSGGGDGGGDGGGGGGGDPGRSWRYVLFLRLLLLPLFCLRTSASSLVAGGGCGGDTDD